MAMGMTENGELGNDGRSLFNVRVCAGLQLKLYHISFTLPV